MYYEESIIDGILHYRTNPNGKWESFSLTTMANKYVCSQIMINDLTEQVEQLIVDGNDIPSIDSDKLSMIEMMLYNLRDLRNTPIDDGYLIHKISAYEEILQILES